MTRGMVLTAALAVVLACVCGVMGQVAPHVTASAHGIGTQHCSSCSLDANCELRGQNNQNQLEFECVCRQGYTGDGLSCSAVNPCASGRDNCDANAVCNHHSGVTYDCMCNDGYSGDGYTCSDNDECTSRTAQCNAANSACVNTPGSYECVCRAGFQHSVGATGVGVDTRHCVDTDECSLGQPCPSNSQCRNTLGSYTCDCLGGSVKSKDGLYCIDLDECSQVTPHPCDTSTSVCNNLAIGFECQCLVGYQHTSLLDTVGCVDIDECADTHHCPVNGVCTNTGGSYHCSCGSGFQLSLDGKYCVDENECAAVINPCDENRSVCRNTPGGYECDCMSGYEHADTNQKICADINECSVEVRKCSKYATCENTIGSHKCNCFYGYEGTGEDCAELSPSLAELEINLGNLSNTQLVLQLHTAYYQNIHLKLRLERVFRLCPLNKAGLLDGSIRAKRDITGDLNGLITGDVSHQRLTLQTLLHHNSEVALKISLLKKSCGLLK